MMRKCLLRGITGLWVGVAAVAVGASGTTATEATTGAVPEGKRGPVTNLPLPRYVSLKTSEGNARRGPDTDHRVDWVFTRRDMPLRVTAEFEHWRRIEDAEGAGGWMHYALLSGVRTATIMEDMTPLHQRPEAASLTQAYLEVGVIARILSCEVEWCELGVDGVQGWTLKANLWGVEPDEVLD
ncbi:SH3 domain-containing protein [Roseicitreum antarcticum]|uniref:SH3-like domain-containing protein n=1 Tax=Roseicitreum antarcticum TaxID=564137 RepID=A0A1H2S2F6_9RHOB|nr:SH3 domain-containing protein [Roseicitreum antarcticum]SDW25690.1 SH3-like domain-containing protein [Roseicitreum antarcticum]